MVRLISQSTVEKSREAVKVSVVSSGVRRWGCVLNRKTMAMVMTTTPAMVNHISLKPR